mmetsp:Transcript_34554/g.88663  ORF Transcript_34554/g.88663 Transcript_34554/m.88663 type:complete len:280 (-) Transcript_34554:62-901(-)
MLTSSQRAQRMRLPGGSHAAVSQTIGAQAGSGKAAIKDVVHAGSGQRPVSQESESADLLGRPMEANEDTFMDLPVLPLADDDDERPAKKGRAWNGHKGGRCCFCFSSACSRVSAVLLVLTLFVLMVCAWSLEPSAKESLRAGARAASAMPLFHWRGHVPDCVAQHFIISGRGAELFKGRSPSSPQLAVLRSGAVVRRTGPCESEVAGATSRSVRMPAAALASDCEPVATGAKHGGNTLGNTLEEGCVSARQAGLQRCVHGWVTLTSGSGERLFEPAPDG